MEHRKRQRELTAAQACLLWARNRSSLGSTSLLLHLRDLDRVPEQPRPPAAEDVRAVVVLGQGSPIEIDFDDLEDIRAQADRIWIRTAADLGM